MKQAIFPGTFDPYTIGHYSLVERGLNLFDKIIIAVGSNAGKKTMFSVEERIEIIRLVINMMTELKSANMKDLQQTSQNQKIQISFSEVLEA